MAYLVVVAVAFGLSLALGPLVLWVLRRVQVVDVPSDRSLHVSATPRGGGGAPALACVAAASVSTRLVGLDRVALIVVAVGLGTIGLADDLKQRPALARL